MDHTTMTEQPCLVVCCAEPDRQQVGELAEWMKKAGLCLLFGCGSENRPEEVRSPAVLAFVSGAFEASDACRETLRRAEASSRTVVPVLMEDMELPGAFSGMDCCAEALRLKDYPEQSEFLRALLKHEKVRLCLKQANDKPYTAEPPRVVLERVDLTGSDYSRLLGNGTEQYEEPWYLNRTGSRHPTIFIGLGGMGVKTLDRLKGKLQEEFQPGWQSNVAFLAVDTDLSEIERVQHLSPDQCLLLNAPRLNNRICGIGGRSQAMERIIRDDANMGMLAGTQNGRGCEGAPVMGKVRLFDQTDDGVSGDEQILQCLERFVSCRTRHAAYYHVCVIASGCGGTGAGMFLELPAILDRMSVDCMMKGFLYLPDVFQGAPQWQKNQMEANCYGVLKEWNYYQAEENWNNGASGWPSNIPGEPVRERKYRNSLYTMPYLVGAAPGKVPQTPQEACGELVELLTQMVISEPLDIPGYFNEELCEKLERRFGLLGVDGCRSMDPQSPGTEAKDSAHEFPNHFVCGGIAVAEMDRGQIWAYRAREVLRQVGLTEERGFLDRNCRVSAAEGTRMAEELLYSLHDLWELVWRMSCERSPYLSELMISPVAHGWDEALSEGRYRIQREMELRVRRAAQRETDGRLSALFREKFDQFQSAVRNCVEHYGPFAFTNLFRGEFRPNVRDGEVEHGIGIHQMLWNLTNGREANGGERRRIDVAEAEAKLVAAEHAMHQARFPLGIDLGGRRKQLLQEWVNAAQKLMDARVYACYLEQIVGENGIFRREFLKKAEALCLQIESFGEVLRGISKMYEQSGDLLEQELPSGYRGLDLLRFHPVIRQELYLNAKQDAQQIDPQRFRKMLLDDFWDGSEQWLDVPRSLVKEDANGQIQLADPTNPIPARARFDSLLRNTTLYRDDFTVGWFFRVLSEKGVMEPAQTLRRIKMSLEYNSVPGLNVRPDGTKTFSCLRVPAELVRDRTIGAALKMEYDQSPWNQTGAMHVGEDPFRMVMVTCMGYQELYQLRDLRRWAHCYEEQIAMGKGYMIHGKSPDLEILMDRDGTYHFRERTGWEDFPAITLPGSAVAVTRAPTREEQIAARMRQLTDEGRRLGVLRSWMVDGAWHVSRLELEGTGDWCFDPRSCKVNDRGLVDLDGKLSVHADAQNGGRMEQHWKNLEIFNCGVLSQGAQTEEQAWDQVSRILRVSHRQRQSLEHTLERFRPWAVQVREYNEQIMLHRRPSLFAELMRSGIVTCLTNGNWVYYPNGGEYVTFYSADANRMGNSPDVELLNQGFVCFCAWRKLMEGLSDEQLWAESERSRRLLNQWLESDHTVALNAQRDQMEALSRECVIYEDAPLVCESADVIETMNVFYCNVLNA